MNHSSVDPLSGWRRDDYGGLPRVLRPYDAGGRILHGRVIDEGDIHPERVIAGCYTLEIDRA